MSLSNAFPTADFFLWHPIIRVPRSAFSAVLRWLRENRSALSNGVDILRTRVQALLVHSVISGTYVYAEKATPRHEQPTAVSDCSFVDYRRLL